MTQAAADNILVGQIQPQRVDRQIALQEGLLIDGPLHCAVLDRGRPPRRWCRRWRPSRNCSPRRPPPAPPMPPVPQREDPVNAAILLQFGHDRVFHRVLSMPSHKAFGFGPGSRCDSRASRFESDVAGLHESRTTILRTFMCQSLPRGLAGDHLVLSEVLQHTHRFPVRDPGIHSDDRDFGGGGSLTAGAITPGKASVTAIPATCRRPPQRTRSACRTGSGHGSTADRYRALSAAAASAPLRTRSQKVSPGAWWVTNATWSRVRRQRGLGGLGSPAPPLREHGGQQRSREALRATVSNRIGPPSRGQG